MPSSRWAPKSKFKTGSPRRLRVQFFKDLSLSAITAGFVAVLVGLTSSVAIVFQAAQAFHATPAQIASWMWALGVGMGLCTMLPSLYYKKPITVQTPSNRYSGIAQGVTLSGELIIHCEDGIERSFQNAQIIHETGVSK